MKKVLYISYYYLPASLSAAQRVYSFAKYIKSVKPYVLCPEKIDAIYTNSDFAEDEDIEVKRVANMDLSFFRNAKNNGMKDEPSNDKGSFLFTLLNMFLYPDKGLFWIFKAIKKGVKWINDENIDLVFSTSPLFSNHIIAYYISKRTKAKWVMDVRDYHYILYKEESKSLFRYLDKWLERKFLLKADAVTFISKLMKQKYIQKYPFLKGKSEVVLNGYDTKEIGPVKKIDTGIFSVLYAGTFYEGLRSPFPLLAALSYLFDEGLLKKANVKIEIIGHIEAYLVDQMKSFTAFEVVNILGPKHRYFALKKMETSDLLWLIIPDVANHSDGFPVKGYEYLASGNKILGFVPMYSMADEILKTTQTGIVLSDKMDAKTIKENALKILNFINDKDFSPNWDEIQKYTREKQALIMEKIIIDL